jgi:hypothetical protein
MILLVSHRLILDGDPLWAIATGKWIAVHHAVPAADPFSWTAWGKPWVCPEWGFDLLAYLLDRPVRILRVYVATLTERSEKQAGHGDGLHYCRLA